MREIATTLERHDTRRQNIAVSKYMISLLGEGGSLSFNNNSTGDYAKKWTIDTSIFSLRTFLCPPETRIRCLGCLSSHICIGQDGFPPKSRADFLTVHHWIKALQEMKEPNTVDVTDGLHDLCMLVNILLVSSFVPGARAVTVALSLGRGTAD